MGGVISAVTGIIDLVHTIKSNKKKDKLNDDIEKKKDIMKPIIPPKFYSTIEARRKNVKKGPYTVEAMAKSLKDDLIPVGYSLEQLSEIGFGADVDEYKRRHKQTREEDKKNLINGLTELKKKIQKGFIDRKDLSEEDKNIIKKNNLFDPAENKKYVEQLDSWIDLARREALSEEVLDNMLSLFNLKISGYQDALRSEELKKQNKEMIDNAVLSEDKKVLNSVKRAFADGYGINKF